MLGIGYRVWGVWHRARRGGFDSNDAGGEGRSHIKRLSALKKSVNEGFHKISLILLKNIMCSNLHCQETFKLRVFSCKISLTIMERHAAAIRHANWCSSKQSNSMHIPTQKLLYYIVIKASVQ